MRSWCKHRTKRRSAVVLVAVVVCLAVMLVISGTVAQSLVLQHRASRREQQQYQALWLAESALGRAMMQLRRDRTYRGETWRVVFDHADGTSTAGLATIAVETPADEPEQRRLEVQAAWPEAPPHRVMIRRSSRIRVSEPPAQEPPAQEPPIQQENPLP